MQHELPDGEHESPVAETWDAGEQGCGELILELRQRLARLLPGQIFCLVTRDSGAVLDVPAWCRLTGHKLDAADPPRYYIRRRD